MSRSEIPPANDGKAPRSRTIASGDDWKVAEYVCTAGPDDRPFEEKHEGFTIAAVVEGAFTYRCDAGRALLHPGAVLFGNHGYCFECGHDHSRGDRCVALHLSPALYSEIAATAAGSARFQLPPAAPSGAHGFIDMIISLEAAADNADEFLIEEITTSVAERALSMASGHLAGAAALSARDEKRVSDALLYIEDNAGSPIDLSRLAKAANMSKYHFLRVFRRAVGMSPYQYVLRSRMRRAAVRLMSSSKTVSAIAFEAGFGDLSTFNRRFREQFDVGPRRYRKLRAPMRHPRIWNPN